MPWNALQIHSPILIAKIVEKVGSDSSIDLDPQKWPSNFIILFREAEGQKCMHTYFLEGLILLLIIL